MQTRTSRLIDETLRQWDDYAEIEDEDRVECVMAHVERQRMRKLKAASAAETETSSVKPGYSVSSAWDAGE